MTESPIPTGYSVCFMDSFCF